MRQVVSRPQLKVGHDPIDRGHDHRALQVELRCGQIRKASRKIGRCLLHARLALFTHFEGDELTQSVSLRCASRRASARMARSRATARLGLMHGDLVTGGVEAEKRIALVYDLIVDDRNARYEPGLIGCHAHDIRSHAPIAGPGGTLVVDPHPAQHDNRNRRDGKRDRRRAATRVSMLSTSI